MFCFKSRRENALIFPVRFTAFQNFRVVSNRSDPGICLWRTSWRGAGIYTFGMFPASSLMHLVNRPLSLTTIPVDILDLIVHHVSSIEPMGPPRGLLALVSTCRTLYCSLSIHDNTSVYGHCFRLNFDISAPLRRFDTESDVDASRTGSPGLAAEFCARFAALHYMRAVVNAQNVFIFSEQETLLHLWAIYFMCIESDSKNHKYLFRYGHMRAYAELCLDQYLFQSLDAPSLLPDTVDRSLMMWILWFSTSWGMFAMTYYGKSRTDSRHKMTRDAKQRRPS
jgi:hypothetical protein